MVLSTVGTAFDEVAKGCFLIGQRPKTHFLNISVTDSHPSLSKSERKCSYCMSLSMMHI